MAMLDYKVFQHCGVLVSLIKNVFYFNFLEMGSGVSFDNVSLIVFWTT